MTDSDLIQRLEAATGPDRELDFMIADAALGPVKGPYRRGHCEKYTSSIEGAMTLLQTVSWLAPILDYTDTSARLVNGIGLAVKGNDHRSVAQTMPLALCLAILRARGTS